MSDDVKALYKDLSLVDPLVPEYESSVDDIATLPGCGMLSGLPDAGLGNHETPYGVVAAFKDFIVPQLLGSAGTETSVFEQGAPLLRQSRLAKVSKCGGLVPESC